MCSIGGGSAAREPEKTTMPANSSTASTGSSGGGSSAEPTQYQQSKTPVYRDRKGRASTGRRGTILTGGQGIRASSPTLKKTALGQ